MIKALRLTKFKAFDDTGDVELKPITVLAGPNSGGKSSILQSLLLLKQTLGVPAGDRQLNLDGEFLEVFGLDALSHGKPTARRAVIGYTLTLEDSIPASVVSRYFRGIQVPKDAPPLPLESRLRLVFRNKEVDTGTLEPVLTALELTSRVQGLDGPMLRMARRKGQYRVRFTGLEVPEPFQRQGVVGEVLFVSGFLPLVVYESDPDEGTHSVSLSMDPIFSQPLSGLRREIADRLQYLGPLREEPRRAYLRSGSPARQIGRKGEHAAQILQLERDNPVEYQPAAGGEPITTTLIDAVRDAFGTLGMTQFVDVKSVESIVYQILFGLSDGPRKVTIADVGFGVSQLLPIVVMGIRSQESSLLLLEQPEIHLHPSLQANLADFLLSLAVSGRRLLVETHSEHLINRLRRRIAEDETDELKEKVSILFVRPPRDGAGATIEPLRIDRFGAIENWPPDFLPEAADEAEAILRASLQKRSG